MVDFAKLVLEVDTSDLEQGEAKLKNLAHRRRSALRS